MTSGSGSGFHSPDGLIPTEQSDTPATMLERMGRAIAQRDGDRFKGATLYDNNPDLYLDLARAGLLAIREPDVEMVCAGRDELPYMQTTPDHVRSSFTAIIDAILSEGAGE